METERSKKMVKDYKKTEKVISKIRPKSFSEFIDYFSEKHNMPKKEAEVLALECLT